MAKRKQTGGFGSPVSKGLTQGRTDMGVDYSGTGDILAVQDGVVTYIGHETGSGAAGGNGPFLIYRTASGRYVFVAEQWNPGVKVGQRIKKGQAIGKVNGGHIEVGWAAGPTGNWNTAAHAHYHEGDVTSEGKSFAAAIAGGSLPSASNGFAAPAAAAAVQAAQAPQQPQLTFPSAPTPSALPDPSQTVPQPAAPGSEGLGITSVAAQWQQIAAQPMASPESQQFAQQLSSVGGP